MENIHLISLNAQGLRDRSKRLRLKQWLTQQKTDVLFLQETHFTTEIISSIINEFSEWDVCNSFGKSNSRGCSIFIRKQLNFKIINQTIDEHGRYIIMNIEIKNDKYSLINIYSPNDHNQRNTFFNDMILLLTKHSNGIKIIGGDFNDTLNKEDRITKHLQDTSKHNTCKNLLKLIETYELTDIWKTFNKNKNMQYTWRRKNSIEKSRIDFWLIDSNITPLILSTDIRPAMIQSTDHLAISIKMKYSYKRGPGYWKLNNSLLEDKNYIKTIISIIESCSKLQLNNILKWEFCKYEIKKASINFSIKKSKEKCNHLQNLEDELKLLINQNKQNARKTELETEIEEIYKQKAIGAQIRSRTQLLNENEKNSKFFLNLEKSRQNRKTITSLTVNDRKITDMNEILEEEMKFYERLYSTSSFYNTDNLNNSEPYSNTSEYLENININYKLKIEEAELCEGKITSDEFNCALNNMKPNKSPGLDGLTVEFYQKFSKHLSNILINSFEQSFISKELSRSQKQCVISLLYKKDNPENLENWRPISLLNIDYKIIAKILANRLQKVLPLIISPDQQGFIKNRFIGNNIRLIQDIIEYVESLNMEGVVLFLDFKKAFDTVEWSFLFEVLAKFGFKHNFISWVKILYTNICSSVINNGWRSNFFRVSRGLRQGCPLSALLFLIVAEILSTAIRMSQVVKGIPIKVENNVIKHIKITQLADDTTLFLKNIHEISFSIKIIDEFGKHSGLILNKNKTECLLIGRSKQENHKHLNEIKCNKVIKALGTYFGTDNKICEQLNWNSKIDTCKMMINKWNARHLTFYGKITVIKSLILPKFTYLMQSITTPKHIINEINTILYKFLWSNKKEKVKRAILITKPTDGGLGMIDLNTYIKTLKMKWVKTLNEQDNSSWKILPTYYFNQYGTNMLIFKMNIDSFKCLPSVRLNIPLFYKEILENFIELRNSVKSKIPKSFFDVRTQIIWGNQYIKYNGKCLIYNNWIKSNIIFINDIIVNGKVDQNTVLTKLTDKSNWMSEYLKCINAIPKKWKECIKQKHSVKSYVKTTLNIPSEVYLNNKSIRYIFISKVCQTPYIHKYWEKQFKKEINWKSFYFNLNKTIIDNRIRQFKFKMVNNIIASNENLCKWKLYNDPLCFHCKNIETINHLLIECPYINTFWKTINEIIKFLGINKRFDNLEYLLIGYKSEFRRYDDFNILLNIIGFIIYKSFLISNRRKERINILQILYNDLLTLKYYYQEKSKDHVFLFKFIELLKDKLYI